jgi:hypothetical protein
VAQRLPAALVNMRKETKVANESNNTHESAEKTVLAAMEANEERLTARREGVELRIMKTTLTPKEKYPELYKRISELYVEVFSSKLESLECRQAAGVATPQDLKDL